MLFRSSTVNVPRTVTQGLELGLNGTLDQQWQARWVILYSDFRFDNHLLYANNRMPGVPPIMMRGEFLHRWPLNSAVPALTVAYAGPTFEWVPMSAPMDNTNSVFLASSESFAFATRSITIAFLSFSE